MCDIKDYELADSVNWADTGILSVNTAWWWGPPRGILHFRDKNISMAIWNEEMEVLQTMLLSFSEIYCYIAPNINDYFLDESFVKL